MTTETIGGGRRPPPRRRTERQEMDEARLRGKLRSIGDDYNRMKGARDALAAQLAAAKRRDEHVHDDLAKLLDATTAFLSAPVVPGDCGPKVLARVALEDAILVAKLRLGRAT